jgi:hypothetical protein
MITYPCDNSTTDNIGFTLRRMRGLALRATSLRYTLSTVRKAKSRYLT